MLFLANSSVVCSGLRNEEARPAMSTVLAPLLLSKASTKITALRTQSKAQLASPHLHKTSPWDVAGSGLDLRADEVPAVLT